MPPKIRTPALFESFTSLIPQDGSVQTIQNYTYHPIHNIRIGNTPPPGRLVLKLERFHLIADDVSNVERAYQQSLPLPPLNLRPGAFLRIQCLQGFSYREIKFITPGIPGTGSGMVVLKSACDYDPTPGGEIRVIASLAQHCIDDRLYDAIEKGKVEAFDGRYYKKDYLDKLKINR